MLRSDLNTLRRSAWHGNSRLWTSRRVLVFWSSGPHTRRQVRVTARLLYSWSVTDRRSDQLQSVDGGGWGGNSRLTRLGDGGLLDGYSLPRHGYLGPSLQARGVRGGVHFRYSLLHPELVVSERLVSRPVSTQFPSWRSPGHYRSVSRPGVGRLYSGDTGLVSSQ